MLWIMGGSIKVVMRRISFIALAFVSTLSAAPCTSFAIPGVEQPATESRMDDERMAQTNSGKQVSQTSVSTGKPQGFHQEGAIIGLDKQNGVGIINIGQDKNVIQGDMFAVVRVKDKIVDPATGEVIRVIQEFIGTVEAVSVRRSNTDVKLDKGAKYIEEGDSVRRKPSTPSGISIKNISTRRIEIIWNLSYEPEVRGYKIYRSSESNTGPFELIEMVTKGDATSFEDRSSSKFPIVEGKVYHYRVSSYHLLNNDSDQSNVVTISAKDAPAPPANLKAEGDKIRSNYLEWTPIEDPDVSGYKIFRTLGKQGEFVEVDNLKGRETRNYTDYGGGKPLSPKLEDSTEYSYKVSTYNIFGTEGPKSPSVSATTAPPPTVPTGFSAKGMQPRMVPLTWDVHPDPNVKGYIISRSDSPDGPFEEVAKIEGRNISNYVDKGAPPSSGWGVSSTKKGTELEDAHLYFYKVQAYNWVDSRSDYTSAVSVLTKPVSFPPEKFTATSNRPRQVPLEWRPVPDITIAWYEVFRSDTVDGEFKKIGAVKSDSSHYLDEKLPDGKNYFYKIRAVDKFGLIGEFTDPISATTKLLPAKVAGLRWEIISGEPTLLWNANPEVDIKEYIIYEKGFFGWSKVGTSKTAQFIIRGLASGSTSSFAVSAVDGDDLEGEKSESTTVRP